jgi:YD repeat-containing protein
MKRFNQLLILLISVLILNSCKKTTTPMAPPGTTACKPTTESTTLSGNDATYEYTYGTNGKISLIKKFIGGGYHVLSDSIVVGDYTIVAYNTSNSGFPMIQTIVYNGSLDGMPTEANVALQEGAITHTNVWHYFFFYDNKNRLNKVGEQTDNVIGDWEYDLDILYNDQDNVVALKYTNTTGPNTIITIPAAGYDDKPNPYTGIKNWYFLMHAAWNNYDPEPLFTARSKNNPLGYTTPDGFNRAMTYTYNDKGFPIKRMNTNTNTSGTYSFEETYGYQCQ